MEANKDLQLSELDLVDPELDSIQKQLVKSVADSLLQQHEDLIEGAIRYALRKPPESPINLDEIKDRGRVERLPDGKEVFFFDSIPLVEFFPVAFNTSNQGLSTYWNATQHYRKLYNNNDGGKL